MKINAQPGYVVIEFTPPEEQEAGHLTLESGIVVPEHVAEAQKAVLTHLESKVLGVSERSELKVGAIVITQPNPVIIEVCIGGETVGIMPENEVFAHFMPEDKVETKEMAQIKVITEGLDKVVKEDSE